MCDMKQNKFIIGKKVFFFVILSWKYVFLPVFQWSPKLITLTKVNTSVSRQTENKPKLFKIGNIFFSIHRCLRSYIRAHILEGFRRILMKACSFFSATRKKQELGSKETYTLGKKYAKYGLEHSILCFCTSYFKLFG